MNAHPSIKTQVFDGWILRFANGYTNRANSVNPLYSSEVKIEEKGYIKVTPTNVMTIPLSENRKFSGKSVVTDKKPMNGKIIVLTLSEFRII